MPTTSATSSITSTIQALEAQYAPDASSAARNAVGLYYGSVLPLEIASALITIAFVVGIIMIVVKTGYVRVRIERVEDVVFNSNHAKKHTKKEWGEIERHFFSGSENDLKIAIVKADTLLDEALREAGVPGADMGERLRRMKPGTLPDIDHAWEAHKLRNRIAHEADLPLKRDLAERVLTVYEEALEHIGMLNKLPGGEKSGDPTSEE